MIIDKFNIVGIAVTPGETNAPLAIDANAMLPAPAAAPAAAQLLQPIAGQPRQILDGIDGMQYPQFLKCPALQFAIHRANVTLREYC